MRIHSFFSALACLQFFLQIHSEEYVYVQIPEVRNSKICILPFHMTLVLEPVDKDGGTVLKYRTEAEGSLENNEQDKGFIVNSTNNEVRPKKPQNVRYTHKYTEVNVSRNILLANYTKHVLDYKDTNIKQSSKSTRIHIYNSSRNSNWKVGDLIRLELIRNPDVDINVPVYFIRRNNGFRQITRLHAPLIKGHAHYHSGTSYLSLQCHENKIQPLYIIKGSVTVGNIKYTVDIMEDPTEDLRGNLTREKTLYKLVPDIEQSVDHQSDHHRLQVKKSEDKIEKYKTKRRRKRWSIEEIYLDVLVVTDYAIYQEWVLRENDLSNTATDNIRRYFSHVINGVSARYKSMESTIKINIRLVGIIIADSPETAPWTEVHKEKIESRYQVDADIVLEALKQWVVNSTDIPPHDHVMLFTGYDLYGNDNGFRFNYTTGLAYIGTMCQGDGRSVSIVEDHGGFQSVGTATHEIGHSLGADHDGTNNTCSSKNRYIMAGQSFNETTNNAFNPWTFSRCSIKYFTDYINSISDSIKQRQCLVNKLEVDVTLPDVFNDKPGQEFSPDQQCTNIYGNTSYLCRGTSFGSGESICKAMFCRNPHTTRKCVLHSAAEGTSCGDRKWCEQGHCVYSKLAPSRQVGCIFGDQAGVIFEGKTCDMLLKESPGYCYIQSFWDRCCQSCYTLQTGVKGCEFGDKVLHCKQANCGQSVNNGTLYDIDCCGTCSYHEHQATTQSSTETTASTDPTTRVCEDITIYNSTCSNYLQLNGKLECYKEQVYEKCCQSCLKMRSRYDDCEFGDRIIGCDKHQCISQYDYSKTSYSDQCCETCQSDQSDDNTVDNECHDKGTVNHLTCAVFLEKYGHSNCYIPDVFDNCCQTCSQLQKDVPSCKFGDRDPRVCQKYITTTNNCDEKYQTLCCESCELLERQQQLSNHQESLGRYLSEPILLIGMVTTNIVVVLLHGF